MLFSLIISCPYEPTSILELLGPMLSGSANVVVHAPTIQVCKSAYLEIVNCKLTIGHSSQTLMPALQYMRNSDLYIAVTLTEPQLRRYQVLLGRTHPEMNGTPHGGFILTAIKVLAPAEDMQPATIGKRTKRPRVE